MVTELETYPMVGYEGDKCMQYRKIAIQLAMQGFDAPRALDCMEVGDVNINLKEVNPETWKPILKTAIERATLEGRAERKDNGGAGHTAEDGGCKLSGATEECGKASGAVE